MKFVKYFLDISRPKGNEDRQFNQPYSTSIDPSDRIYVVDLSIHRIQIFDVYGNFLNKIDSAIGNSKL